jgi:quercetin dioxygenase-like cupin family protein
MADLSKYPLHLGLGATAVPQPEFTGDMGWYMDYGARNGGDGAEGRLVSMHHFTQSWDSWEMHPMGDEVVVCTSGSMTLIQEFPDGRVERTTIGAGEYAINPPGVWHTVDIEGDATALFITAGMGTEGRGR